MGIGAAEQRERVRYEVEHGLERGNGSLRAARQIHDERISASAGYGATKRGQRGAARSGGAHAFGKAVEDAAADGACSFRCDIPRSNPGAPSGDDQGGMGGVGAQRDLDLRLFVGNKVRPIDLETGCLK